MTRISRDLIDGDGVVRSGFDYDVQVWVEDYTILECGHPSRMSTSDTYCCVKEELAGQDIRLVQNHQVRL